MKCKEAAIATLNQYCSTLGLTDQGFAARYGLDILTIRRIQNGEVEVPSEITKTMLEIAVGLGNSGTEFFLVYRGFLHMDCADYESMLSKEKLEMDIAEMKARIRSMPDYILGEECLIAAHMTVQENEKRNQAHQMRKSDDKTLSTDDGDK